MTPSQLPGIRHTNTAHAGVGFNVSFIRIDRLRGRVLVRWHDGSHEWLHVPSNVTIRATVDVGSNRPVAGPPGIPPAAK